MSASCSPSPPEQESESESEERKSTKKDRKFSIIFRRPWRTTSEERFEGEVCQRGHMQQTAGDDGDLRVPGVLGTFLISLLAGGVAGAAGKIATSPIDTAKRSISLKKVRERVISFRDAYDQVLKSYISLDYRSLVYGQRASVVRNVPYGAFLFASHEAWKRFLHVKPRSSQWKRMEAGALAGITAVTITYPLDLLRSRAQANFHEDYTNLRTGLKSIWGEGRSGMFRGYLPTVLGIIPYCGVKFYVYDTLKYRHYDTTSRRPGFIMYTVYGTVAGVLGQTVAYPFEVVRRRMQLSLPNDPKYRTITGTLITIYKEEGIKGYFKGVTFNWLGPPFAIGVSFAVFEVVRNIVLGHWIYRHYFND